MGMEQIPGTAIPEMSQSKKRETLFKYRPCHKAPKNKV
jgi:hypothetical protein